MSDPLLAVSPLDGRYKVRERAAWRDALLATLPPLVGRFTYDGHASVCVAFHSLHVCARHVLSLRLSPPHMQQPCAPQDKTQDLSRFFSEMAYQKYRCMVEIEYFIELSKTVPQLADFPQVCPCVASRILQRPLLAMWSPTPTSHAATASPVPWPAVGQPCHTHPQSAFFFSIAPFACLRVRQSSQPQQEGLANATQSFPFSATPTMRAPSLRSHNPLPLRQDRVEDLRGVYKTFGLEEAARVKVRQS
jgi:hypothetical protein